MDGANWLAHYADHRLDPLWRFHALHHSQEELSVLTSFRAHPLMHTTGFLLATVPVVALMPARPIAPVVITIYVCIGTLQHANLRWTFGGVGRGAVSEPEVPLGRGVRWGVRRKAHRAIPGERQSPGGPVRTAGGGW